MLKKLYLASALAAGVLAMPLEVKANEVNYGGGPKKPLSEMKVQYTVLDGTGTSESVSYENLDLAKKDLGIEGVTGGKVKLFVKPVRIYESKSDNLSDLTDISLPSGTYNAHGLEIKIHE